MVGVYFRTLMIITTSWTFYIMKTIQQLINEKTANFEQLLSTRQNLVNQLEQINTTLLELKGHIDGLKAAATASQDPLPEPDGDVSGTDAPVETNNG